MKERGFTLMELVIALVVLAVIISVYSGYEISMAKRDSARKYAAQYVAVDQGAFTVFTQLRSFNNTYNLPVCQSGALTTLVRTSIWQSMYPQAPQNVFLPSYLDPRVEWDKMEFLLQGNSAYCVRLKDPNMRQFLDSYLRNLLGSKYDQNNQCLILNNGNGYPINPVGGC